MTWQAWLTVAVIVGVLGLLISERLKPELAMLAGLLCLMVTGVLSPAQAVAGFSNEGMITVAAMYVVAAALRETGAIDGVSRQWFGRTRSLRVAQLKVMLPVVSLGAFINNTPVVATFLPAVLGWAKRSGLSPSKLLMPLSYAAMLGGTCTLIGTSTNLIVNGLWLSEGGRGLGMFEIAWVGIPVALAGMAYMLLIGGRLLPDRGEDAGAFDDPREYTVEMHVLADGPLVGRTIIDAGLRNLGRLFLVGIVRRGQMVPAVTSEERLVAGDRLVFAGDVGAIIELQRMRGLEPVRDEPAAITQNYPERRLVEVVLSPRCPLIGQTLRESRFHTHYGASVVAVAREGRRLPGALGEMRLRAADTLLLEARPVWVDRHRFSPDFLLVSQVDGSEAPRHRRAPMAWLVLAGIIVSAALGWLPMITAALLGAGLMLALGCVSVDGARKSIDTQVLVVIACSFALGRALQVSGAAEVMASAALSLAGGRPWMLLAMTYVVTSIATEVITNNAAAVLIYPIAVAAAQAAGLEPLPFIIAVMMAASASFATPMSYQTNLMVAGPGRYRFVDFLRVGLPLNLVVGTVTIAVIPWVWDF